MTEFRAYGHAENFVPLIVSTPTLTSYFLHTTPLLVAGQYTAIAIMSVNGTNSGTDIDVVVEIDGVPLGLVRTEAVVPSGGFVFTGLPNLDWGAGDQTHTFEFFLAQPGGPGSAQAVFGSFAWWRQT